MAHNHIRPSMLTVFRSTILESGLRSLYTGLSASILRQMTYSMVRLSSYDEMKAWLSRRKQPSTAELFAVAMLAGVFGGIAGNPAGDCKVLAVCCTHLPCIRHHARTYDERFRSSPRATLQL